MNFKYDEIESRLPFKIFFTLPLLAATSRDPEGGATAAPLNLAAPFGDPITNPWNTSKQNLLNFGPSNYNKKEGTFEHEDTQSVSTVSGSGMNFFRKFVQRKGPKNEPLPPENDEQDCKECENQFRREVLIDRLLTDAVKDKADKQGSSVSSDKGTMITGLPCKIKQKKNQEFLIEYLTFM